MAIKINVQELEIENTKINKLKVVVSLGLFRFKTNKEKIKRIINKNSNKIKLEIKDFKYILQRIEIPKITVKAKLGTENPALTAFVVTIISSLLGIILVKKTDHPKYEIEPIYTNQNYVFLSINCIFKIKLVHIINIIKKPKGKEYQKYGGTPNRRTYGDCNGQYKRYDRCKYYHRRSNTNK